MTSATPQKESLRVESHVGHLLRRAYQRATANLHAKIAETGLTARQLATLARLAELGPLSQNRLGRLIDMEPANIHSLVRRLARRGLVSIDHDETDRRRLIISLTGAGESLFREAQAPSERANEETLSPLNAAERRDLFRLLQRIADPPQNA